MDIRIGKIISQLRTKEGLTQREFADILGVSNGAIGMWETGKRQPDLDMVLKIAEYFHVSADCLLGTNAENSTEIYGVASFAETSIKKWVQKTGYRYDEFADKLGISKSLFIEYINNKKNVPYELLYKISEICGVSTDCLLGRISKSRERDFDNILPFKYNYKIAERIKKLCSNDVSVTPSFLEDLLSLSGDEVHDLIEYGFVPHMDTIIKLSQYFNISADFLLCIIDEQEEKILSAFKKLSNDNKDIIIGEIKKCLKEQRYEDSVAAESRMKEAK